MNIAVDIETKGLDATKFIMGCVLTEHNLNKPTFFTNKRTMWNHILKLATQCSKHKKILNVYAHNHMYDFLGYAPVLTDQHIKWYSENPFIVAYKNTKGKEIIKFLDTYSIFNMALWKLGELINTPKLTMPNELLNTNTTVTPKLIERIKPYNHRDCVIVLRAIQYLKSKLATENIRPKRFYTISQIGMSHMLAELKKQPRNQISDIFYDIPRNKTYQTIHADKIHQAYRGGRVECFDTGTFADVTLIDKSSFYGKCLCEITIPSLKDERKIRNPLSICTIEELLKKPGISKCALYNKSCSIGLLPVRTKWGSYYPKPTKYIMGTYTHTELKCAMKNGYELIDIEYSVIYEPKSVNPFVKPMQRLWNLRVKSDIPFDTWFYKYMMNTPIGKFAQSKPQRLIEVIDINGVAEYTKKAYEIIESLGYNMIIETKTQTPNPKPYYAPIIPTLVNAHARVQMFNDMKQIKPADLLYTDTDSIMFKHDNKYLKKLNVTDKPTFGGYKVEEQQTDAIIYSRKTYSIGDTIKAAGIHRGALNKNDFELGYITYNQMNTLRTRKSKTKPGTFSTYNRNLIEQKLHHQYMNREMNNLDIYMDFGVTEWSYLLKTVKGHTQRKGKL